MKTQRGFTLIEIMIVVAIIAILGSIAVVVLPDYAARAQLTEAIELTAGLKTPIGEAYANSNEATSCSIPASAITQGKYVLSIVTANAGPDHCELIATMRNAINNKASGRIITVTYTPSTGEWACMTNAPEEATPSACR